MKQRQALGSSEFIAPWGKAPVAQDAINEQSCEDFSLQPPTAGIGGRFGNMPKCEQALEPFDGQFHLPAAAIYLQDYFGGKIGWRQCREHKNISHQLQGFGLDRVMTVIAVFAFCFSPGSLGIDCTLADRTQSGGIEMPFPRKANPPFAACLTVQTPQARQHPKRSSIAL